MPSTTTTTTGHRALFTLLATAGLLVACGGPTTLRYDDLLTEGALRGGGEPAQTTCFDETHFVLPIRAEEVVEATFDPDDRGTLVLGGCLPDDQPATTIGVTITDGETVREESWTLPEQGGWWEHRLPVGRFSRDQARVQVRTRGAATVYLRDVYQARPSEPDPGAHATPRVLLISVDTLRSDAIASLGGPWPTPNLDRLVAEGQAFVESYAGATWTKPSHGTMLTGHAPMVHQAISYEKGLHPAVPTVAERFAEAGFRTAALVSDIVHLDPRFGFDRGFDDYRTEHWSLGQSVRHVLRWIDDHGDAPWLYFFHTFEVHSDFHALPYESPGETQHTIAEQFGVERYGCIAKACASGRLARMERGEFEPIEGEAAILRHLYGASVRHLDQQLGVLFEGLRQRGLYDDTLILLTSDHGEMLLEHGAVMHGDTWQQVLRVPLIVKWPGGREAGTRSTIKTSGVDIVPTLLAAVGAPHDQLPGSDLATLRRRDRPIFAGTSKQVVLRDQWKLTFERRFDRIQLFDLSAEGDTRDLAASEPTLRQDLDDLLGTWRRDNHRRRDAFDAKARQGDDVALSEEDRARLQALGYLDG